MEVGLRKKFFRSRHGSRRHCGRPAIDLEAVVYAEPQS
jgi:hypothetical protein